MTKKPTKPAKSKTRSTTTLGKATNPWVTVVVRPKKPGDVRLPGEGRKTVPAPWWPDVVTISIERAQEYVDVRGWSIGVDVTQKFRARFVDDVIAQWTGTYGSAWTFEIFTHK